MCYVHIDPESNEITQILNPQVLSPDIAYWYGEEFSSNCVQAPNEVDQRWIYKNGEFTPPEEEPAHVLTPAEQRKLAYETEPLIEWEGEQITVDAANRLWLGYAAEESPKADELQTMIIAAKTEIRERFPDEVTADET